MQSKHIKWIAIAGGVIAAIAAVAIFQKVKAASGRKNDHNAVPPDKVKPVQGPSYFPLKNGSAKNDLVKQLQGYLGVTVDGLFGPKTAAALLAKTGKTSIASQSDFDQVIKKLAGAAQASVNTTRADKLVSDWTKNSALRLIAVSPVQAYGIVEDAYGALVTNNKDIGLVPGFNYNREDYIPLSSTQAGYLKFKVTKGDRMGLYKVDPSKISVA